jgi:hypothetical protein
MVLVKIVKALKDTRVPNGINLEVLKKLWSVIRVSVTSLIKVTIESQIN